MTPFYPEPPQNPKPQILTLETQSPKLCPSSPVRFASAEKAAQLLPWSLGKPRVGCDDGAQNSSCLPPHQKEDIWQLFWVLSLRKWDFDHLFPIRLVPISPRFGSKIWMWKASLTYAEYDPIHPNCPTLSHGRPSPSTASAAKPQIPDQEIRDYSVVKPILRREF